MWKIDFFLLEEIACLSTESRTPENPSLLPQNRTKCLGGTSEAKQVLYGVLKRAVKIL